MKTNKRGVGKESEHDYSMLEDDQFVPKKWFWRLGRVNT